MDYRWALASAKTKPVMREGWKGRWLIFEGERYKELHDDGSVRLYVATYDEIVASDWRDAPQSPSEP